MKNAPVLHGAGAIPLQDLFCGLPLWREEDCACQPLMRKSLLSRQISKLR